MKEQTLYRWSIGVLRRVASLPFGILYAVSNGMYFLAYYVIRYRRQTVADNLRHSFPEKSKKERKVIERKFYRHLCDCIVETVKLLHFTDREAERRIHVANEKLIEQLAADGAPIVLYLGHYGNWEWVPAVTYRYARPSFNAQIYRPLRNHVMEQVMLTIRSRFHTQSIPQKRAIRVLLRMRQEGKQFLVGFVADQRPNSGNLYHWTTFLNQETAYSTGGEEIGRRTGAHFVYLEVEKTARGHYLMTFCPLTPTENERTEAYPYTLAFMKKMEATIRRAPEYWLWSHRRWRFARKDMR